MSERTLEERIERLEAVHQIQNLMGKYSFFHSARMHKESAELFAKHTPGTRAEMMWGVYKDYEGILRLYPGWHAMSDGEGHGVMHMHALTTPVIEVAGDLKTAKGVWVSPGHVTIPGQANWAWMKYGCDFVKEDEEWKIWHLHTYGIFFCPFERSWAEASLAPTTDPKFAEDLDDRYKPDGPPTTHWMYSREAVYVNEPAPPEPYETFHERDAY